MPDTVHGLKLKNILNGLAADKIEKLFLDDIKKEDGSLSTLQEICKLDPLSVFSATYRKFQAVATTVRAGYELFSGFKSRLDVAISLHRAVYKDAKPPYAIVLFLLLMNGQVVSSQRIFVLASLSFNLGKADMVYNASSLTSSTPLESTSCASPSVPIYMLEDDAVVSVFRSFDEGRERPVPSNTVSTIGLTIDVYSPAIRLHAGKHAGTAMMRLSFKMTPSAQDNHSSFLRLASLMTIWC